MTDETIEPKPAAPAASAPDATPVNATPPADGAPPAAAAPDAPVVKDRQQRACGCTRVTFEDGSAEESHCIAHCYVAAGMALRQAGEEVVAAGRMLAAMEAQVRQRAANQRAAVIKQQLDRAAGRT